MGLSRPLFIYISHFFFGQLQLVIFTIVKKCHKKGKGRLCIVLLHILRKSQTPSKNRLSAILHWKKPKSVQGFKPSQSRENAITLPFVPPPLRFAIPHWNAILLMFNGSMADFKLIVFKSLCTQQVLFYRFSLQMPVCPPALFDLIKDTQSSEET